MLLALAMEDAETPPPRVQGSPEPHIGVQGNPAPPHLAQGSPDRPLLCPGLLLGEHFISAS